MELTDFDVAEYLDDAETIAAYLTEILTNGDTAEFMAALGDVARVRGISKLAVQTGLSRGSLYKSLAPNAKPRFDTVVKILDALGVQIKIGTKSA